MPLTTSRAAFCPVSHVRQPHRSRINILLMNRELSNPNSDLGPDRPRSLLTLVVPGSSEFAGRHNARFGAGVDMWCRRSARTGSLLRGHHHNQLGLLCGIALSGTVLYPPVAAEVDG